MTRYPRKGIYRSRGGAIFGVCRGLSEHFDISLFWVRAIAVVALVLTGLWPAVVLYLLAALIMRPEPAIPPSSTEEQDFYDRYTDSPHTAAQRLKRRYESLEKRIRKMEGTVTSREYDWERRMKT
jgi:phage shock protein C